MNTPFSTFGLADPLLRGVEELGFLTPTPVQEAVIPPLMARRDVMARADTGTGKTAAYGLPLLHHLAGTPWERGATRFRSLVLTPTRELAAQIGDAFRDYGRHLNLGITVVHGGVDWQPQVAALAAGTDVLVATPGRLEELLTRRQAKADVLEVFVLDEADRMLDMGFMPDLRRLIPRLPQDRLSAFLSATLPDEVLALANRLLRDPVRVDIQTASDTAAVRPDIEERLYYVLSADKHRLLLSWLEEDTTASKVLLFCGTRSSADRVARTLGDRGVSLAVLHGDLGQRARSEALDALHTGQVRVLVATDLAARGLDVEGITHVVNYHLPDEARRYVHRIGRTGRAGARGVAISLCDTSERSHLEAIEALLEHPLPVQEDHPWHRAAALEVALAAQDQRGPRDSGHRRKARPGSGKRGGKRRG